MVQCYLCTWCFTTYIWYPNRNQHILEILEIWEMDGVQFAVYGEHLLKFRINQSSRSFRHQIVPIHSKQFLFKLSRPGSGADFIFTLSSNYVTIKTFTGLKILISLFCFGASFYQSFVLFDNFKSKDTLRKNTKMTYPDNLHHSNDNSLQWSWQ